MIVSLETKKLNPEYTESTEAIIRIIRKREKKCGSPEE
jgi:hypothetical protein